MLPRIVHPEQLQGFRLHAQDHCRLALLSAPADGDDDRGSGEAMSLFLEIHDPCDRVPPHSHHRSAEFYFVLRGTVLFHSAPADGDDDRGSGEAMSLFLAVSYTHLRAHETS